MADQIKTKTSHTVREETAARGRLMVPVLAFIAMLAIGSRITAAFLRRFTVKVRKCSGCAA